jgi:hypothetical protein
MPVKIEFEIEGASFVFILAPRVERWEQHGKR